MPSRYVKSGGVFVELGGDGGGSPVPFGSFLRSGTAGPGYGNTPNTPWAVKVHNPVEHEVTQMGIVVGNSAGDICLGIYDDDGTGGVAGTRLATTGQLACPATGKALVALTAALTVPVGWFWLAGVSSDVAFTLYVQEPVTINHYWPGADTIAVVENEAFNDSTGMPLPATAGGTRYSIPNLPVIWAE